MQLQGFGREPSVYAFGAYLMNGDRPCLRVPVLLVRAGHKSRRMTLRDPKTKARFRVLLPAVAAGAEHHMRFEFEELEIL